MKKTTPAPSTALKCAKKCRPTKEIPVSVVFEHASRLWIRSFHGTHSCFIQMWNGEQEGRKSATQNVSFHSKNDHLTKPVRDVEVWGSREAFRWDGRTSGASCPGGCGRLLMLGLTAGLHVNTLMHTHLDLRRAKNRT